MGVKDKKKDSCNICARTIRENAKAVLCDVCNNWVHIKCNSISPSRYNQLCEEDNDESFFYIKCFNQELPFGFENDKSFNQTVTLGLNNDNSNLENLNINISKTEKKLINFLNKTISENNDPNIQNSFCKYYTTDELNSKCYNANQYFSIFHLNINSLQFHKNDLDALLDSLKVKFDVIAISETRLRKGIEPVHDVNLANYEKIDTPTEATKGGTLLYISENLNFKPRKDLEIYESKKIESTFVEIINESNKNIIVGCIYKHHTISPKEFTESMSTLLSKLSKEKKTCYLAGDFNMNLLHLEKKTEIEHYYDVITDAKFTPLITSPTRITTNSKTLIDNIFFNDFSSNIISGNLTVGISDHMPQFALVPRNFSKPMSQTTPTIKYGRKCKSIDTNLFNQDLDKINWDTTGLDDANQYGENFMNVFNQILDIHAPITQLKNSKQQQKRNTKPWITKDILKMIKLKDKTYQKIVKEENVITKTQLNETYKGQKNEITKMIRKSKKIYYNEYFAKNSSNNKKLWAGINQIINKCNNKTNNPMCIEIDVEGNVTTVTDPREIANAFNSHYTTVAENILKNADIEAIDPTMPV